MVRSWQVLIIGVLFGAMASIVAVMALSADVPEMWWGAWVLSAIGGVIAFVGLIAVAVEIGVRSADS